MVVLADAALLVVLVEAKLAVLVAVLVAVYEAAEMGRPPVHRATPR